MYYFSSGRSLSRRSFLHGAGAALALPLLDAMRPAFAREKAAPRRFMAIQHSLGFHGPFFFPKDAGETYTTSDYLAPLQPIRKDFTVFSGLSHPEQNGANGHVSQYTWLTSARHPMLPGFKNSISLDQYIASKIGLQTRFPYIALGTTNDSLAVTSNGVMIPSIQSPAALFRQLFVQGTAAEVKQQMSDIKNGKSILDTVSGEARKLEKSLGKNDQQKLNDYLAAVRSVESQLQVSEGWLNKPKPVVNVPAPTDVTNRLDAIAKQKLLYEMTVLAFQTDSTRTITLAAHGMNNVPVIEGVSHDWHELSHHGQDTTKISELKKIELAEMVVFSEFLQKLKGISEAGGSLLDRSAILFGSNLGNASSHDWTNLPLLVAGGKFPNHGQHLVAGQPKKNTPFCNLFVQLAQFMGIETDKFGTSTGTLTDWKTA